MGTEEGREVKLFQVIRALLSQNVLTDEQIAAATDTTVDVVQRLRNE